MSGRVSERAADPAAAGVWTQVPAIATAVSARGADLVLPEGERVHVRGASKAAAQGLATMACFSREALGEALADLESHGIVGAQDLPMTVVPDEPAALDGWRFA